MKEAKDIAKELTEPFPYEDVEWRVQSCGKGANGIWVKVVAYVTNRAIMERLDSVVGLENWKTEFSEWKGIGTKCCLSVRIGEEWISKCDGCDDPETEKIKGGFSGAMKRAAVMFGIGRYLYSIRVDFLPPQNISVQSKEGYRYGTGMDKKTKQYFSFYWLPPLLPKWALPEGGKIPNYAQPPAQPTAAPSGNGSPTWDGKNWRECPNHLAKPVKLLGDCSAKGVDYLMNEWEPQDTPADRQLHKAVRMMADEMSAEQGFLDESNQEAPY